MTTLEIPVNYEVFSTVLLQRAYVSQAAELNNQIDLRCPNGEWNGQPVQRPAPMPEDRRELIQQLIKLDERLESLDNWEDH